MITEMIQIILISKEKINNLEIIKPRIDIIIKGDIMDQEAEIDIIQDLLVKVTEVNLDTDQVAEIINFGTDQIAGIIAGDLLIT